MKYFITSALPYANGALHFGHLAGAYLPADAITRHLRLLNHEVKFISGTDEHGVAIMLNAKKANKSYKDYVNYWHAQQKSLFDKFQVEFDFFGQTSSDYHAEEVRIWFNELYEKGFIETREDKQLFCNDCKNHLPDRFVEGECYLCKHPKARGDECPSCGAWIEPTKLISPVCKICNSKNIKEVSVTQYYLLMNKYYHGFKAWLETKRGKWRKTVFPYLESLAKEKLEDRAISRDLDWGIDVPLPEAKGKKLYVWFDAPIGYISNLKECLRREKSSDHYLDDWANNSNVTIVNFIGKDNIIFHGIIFPVMSMICGRSRPVDDLPANQYLVLNDQKFSKSDGVSVSFDAVAAIDKYGPDALRYYLYSILPELSDSSFDWKDFEAKVNNELANNIGNLINRCLKFFHKNWVDGISVKSWGAITSSEAFKKLKIKIEEGNEELSNYRIRQGLDVVMKMGHEINTFFSDLAPWAQIKTDQLAAQETILKTSLMIVVLAIRLEPYIPNLSGKILDLYSTKFTDEVKRQIYIGDFNALKDIFGDHVILKNAPDALVPKIEIA